MALIYAAFGRFSARTVALVLCAGWLPVMLARATMAVVRGESLQFRPPRLWHVVRGELKFVGPAEGDEFRGVTPGLVSPGSLRRRMGIEHTGSVEKDAHFLLHAGARERIGLLLRHAWASLLSPATRKQSKESRLLGVRIDTLSMHEAVETIIDACDGTRKAAMKLVAFVNPDCLNKAVRDRDYHHLLNRADLVLPDGSGLRIAARLLKLPLIDNINGTDLLPVLCEKASATGKKIFLFGGRSGVALEAAEGIRKDFPELRIVGCLDGYSLRNNPYAVIRAINASGADIVLTGLGAPHQERWLDAHRDFLDIAVGIGVGGLFDYYSGRIARAPLWLREIGLEWVWRILQEPAAKWRRYIIGNPVFLARVLRERWLRRRLRNIAEPRALPTPSQWAAANTVQAISGTAVEQKINKRWRRGLTVRSVSKRLLDVTVAATALLVLSPLLLLTAAAIRLESPGSVLFRQQRVGRRGRVFDMLKFRSMFIDAEARLEDLRAKNESAGGVLFKMKNDPRITRAGKIIRRYSIDELPQLINVLRGEMSIVGPRPALPSEVEAYSAADRKRLQTNPGLTCLWQIGGRSDLSFGEQVELDIAYLKQQNVLVDIGIMARTVPAVINGKGAY